MTPPVPTVAANGMPEDVTVDALVERFLDEHLLRDPAAGAQDG